MVRELDGGDVNILVGGCSMLSPVAQVSLSLFLVSTSRLEAHFSRPTTLL